MFGRYFARMMMTADSTAQESGSEKINKSSASLDIPYSPIISSSYDTLETIFMNSRLCFFQLEKKKDYYGSFFLSQRQIGE